MRISGADIDEDSSQRFRKVIIVTIIVHCLIILGRDVLGFSSKCCILFYEFYNPIFNSFFSEFVERNDVANSDYLTLILLYVAVRAS